MNENDLTPFKEALEQAAREVEAFQLLTDISEIMSFDPSITPQDDQTLALVSAMQAVITYGDNRVMREMMK